MPEILKENRKPKALANPKTRAQAIYSMCYDCIYDPGAKGSWRAQAEECTATSCPLYEFRAKTIEQLNKDRKAKKRQKGD